MSRTGKATSDLASDLSRTQETLGTPARFMEGQIGNRLRTIRSHRSQQEVANTLGVSLKTYGLWERGERFPDPHSLILLCMEGWNGHWILTGQGPERAEAAVQSQSHDVSGEDLNIAMQLADRKIAAARKAPTREQYAAFVAEIYNAITQGLPDADRFDFATGRRTHTGTGEDDGSGQGVGE